MIPIPETTSTAASPRSAKSNRERSMRTPLVMLAACASLGLFGALRLASAQGQHSVVPVAGFVPDSTTAARIAEAVLIPVYGQRQIAFEQPLSCSLRGGVWTCTGRLPMGNAGGVAEVQMSKRDARILRMTHGR